jgi:hypothetical protein
MDPLDADRLPADLRKPALLLGAVDAMPRGFVCSGRLRATIRRDR